ncbi:MAG TPA: alpha/beta hydrolase fold domain-containing protein [Burkholderiales bacterium]|nr:alpha/beta hydrolase fold domain-containing protein [Burkholderiales bacterium]
MPLDPQVQAVLDAAKKANVAELWQLTPHDARAEYRRRTNRLKVDVDIHRFEDRDIDGSGGKIPIRIYTPRELTSGEKLPVLVWYHGGGYVIGDLDTHDSACRALANEADCIVVAVDYRLAPEHKFPAAVDDCFASLKWVVKHADEINVDGTRIAVGGDSAGGNLAAVVSILARNAGSPKIAFQLLIYPVTAPEPETKSHHAFAEGYLLTRKTITWFFTQYIRSSKDVTDFRYAPLEADDLSSLPPSLIVVAGYDPLRDEGVEYAEALIHAGNRVRLSNYEGMVHGFYLMGGMVDASRRAISESAAMLREAFAPADD